MRKVVAGDNGRLKLGERHREKIRTFAKSCLVHAFTKSSGHISHSNPQ